VSGEAAGQTTDPVLARFLRSLAARDASLHTQRAYATAVGSYLEWLAARGTDWRRPTRADLRAYLGVLGEGRARSSVAQRLAAIGDCLFNGFPVGHASGEVRILRQIAATLFLRKWSNRELALLKI
jgi:site-specific recombinase XerC